MRQLWAIADHADFPGVRRGGLSVDWLCGLSDEPSRDVRAVGQLPVVPGDPTPGGAAAWLRTAVKIKRAVLGARADESVPYWVAPLADLLMTRDLIPYHGSDAGQLKALGDALRRPLQALGLSPAAIGARAFGDYVMTMVPVLFGLAASQAQRRKAEADAREREDLRRRNIRVEVTESAAGSPRKRPKARKPAKPAPRKRRK